MHIALAWREAFFHNTKTEATLVFNSVTDFVVSYKQSFLGHNMLSTAIHTVTSRNFTRDVSAAKRATAHGPVFVTDRGRPAYALLTIEQYYQLDGHAKSRSLLDVMETIASTDTSDFAPPRLNAGVQAASFE
jgi:PHD/YefM family antitoxin component YafN of YafNO toxin-antitoxin module